MEKELKKYKKGKRLKENEKLLIKKYENAKAIH